MLAVKLIPMHLIDEPDVAMRSEIDDDYIRELAMSIAANGLQNAIAVVRHEGRYRVAAGHCRYLACRELGKEEIEAKDYTDSGIPEQAIKGHENLMRRDPSEADTAEWINDMQLTFHYPLDKLMRITGKSEDWLAKRLSLFKGHKEVFDALKRKDINMGQALALNRCPENLLPRYLDAVIKSTPPIRVVEQWVREANEFSPLVGENGEPVRAAQQEPPAPGVSIEVCTLCEQGHSNWEMVFVKVHTGCLQTVVKALRNGSPGGGQ